MTEPQVWAVIGVLAATLASFVGATLTMVIRTVNVQFERVSDKIDGVLAQTSTEVNGLRAEMNARLDNLDRDVQALANRVWGRNRP